MDARVRKLSDFAPLPRVVSAWGLDALAGRFVELSGARATGVLSAAFGLVLEAQRRGEIAVWVTLPRGTFFPPDAAEGGVDLDALVVVRVPVAAAAARAADQLVRSGGFGLVVLDLAGHAGDARLPAPLQSRLGGLAQKHDAAVLALTEKAADQASLGALVSLRAEARRSADCTCTVRVLKDKRRGPGDAHVEACRPPDGLVAAPAAALAKALPFRPATAHGSHRDHGEHGEAPRAL